jgi:hypothetical protein
MKHTKIIYWLPRVLGLVFVLFLSLFAFDVFQEYSGGVALLAFFIHLLPAFILLAVVLIAWKHELFGAIAFLGLALAYVLLAGFGRPWSWYAGISGPAVVIGLLFFLNWRQNKRNM